MAVIGSSDSLLGTIILGSGVSSTPPSLDVTPSNLVFLTQTADVSKVYSQSISQTVTLSQDVLRVVLADAANTLALTATASALRVKNVSAENALTLTANTASASKDIVRAVIETIVLAQSTPTQVYRQLNITETISLVDTLVVTSSLATANILSITQSCSAVVSRSSTSNLVLTQIAEIQLTINYDPRHVLVPYQTLDRQVTLRRSEADTLTLSQQLLIFRTQSAKSTLTLTSTATAYKAQPSSNILTLTSVATLNKVTTLSKDSYLSLTAEVFVELNRGVNGQQLIGLTHSVEVQKIIFVAADNTITFNTELVQDYFDVAASQSLSLVVSADVKRSTLVSVSQTLNLTQSLGGVTTYDRSVSDNLIFKTSHTKPIAFGNVDVPSVQAVIVKQMVILQGPTIAITLPPPQFGDAESYKGLLNIKRTMSGGRYTYKRSNPLEQLNYSFTIGRKKAIELRNFIMINNSTPITMTNWKGEIWRVLLTNNPFQFVEESYWNDVQGNKSSIALEFQGVKLN